MLLVLFCYTVVFAHGRVMRWWLMCHFPALRLMIVEKSRFQGGLFGHEALGVRQR